MGPGLWTPFTLAWEARLCLYPDSRMAVLGMSVCVFFNYFFLKHSWASYRKDLLAAAAIKR